MKKGLLIAVLLALLTIPLGCKAPAEAPPPSPGPLPAAEFEVVSLNVMPPGVRVGETVSVTAEVKNTSDTEGTYAAILTIDGAEAGRKDITVAAGATETVTFTLVKDTPGTYEIAVGELSANLILKGKPQPVELKYDDGTSEGFLAIGGVGRGHLVHFSPAVTPFTINEVKIYGMLYGTGYENLKFEIEIWDEDFNVLYRKEERHTRFSQEPSWVVIDMPGVSVRGDFYIFVCTNSPKEGGIRIGFDSSVINKRSEVTRAGKITDWYLRARKEKLNWMIRIRGVFCEGLLESALTYEEIRSNLSRVKPELLSELDRLPEIRDGISEEDLEALNDIYFLYVANPELEGTFNLMLDEGIKAKRKYCTPLQALLWLAYDREFSEESNLLILKGYWLEGLIRNVWAASSISENYASDKWQDFEEVVDRLNSPELVSIYMEANFSFKFHSGAIPYDARRMFDKRVGDCKDYTMFALYCLVNNGFAYDNFETEEEAACSLCMRRMKRGKREGHAICLYKWDNKFYAINSDINIRIQGPFLTVEAVANATFPNWFRYRFMDVNKKFTKTVYKR